MRSPAALFLCAIAALLACGGGSTSTSTTTTTGTGTAGAGGATTTSTTSTGPCVEAWTCTPWETDGTSDAAKRTCADANKCGTTEQRPVSEATLPALDLDYFKCNVEPILDQRCSMLGCHGTEKGRALRVYARGRKRLAGQTLQNPACGAGSTSSDGCDGSNHCLCAAPHTEAEWRKNFDSARGFGLDDQGKIITVSKMDQSDLLAQPVVDGKAHAGVHLFKKGDPAYTALRSWLTGAKLGAPCDTGVN